MTKALKASDITKLIAYERYIELLVKHKGVQINAYCEYCGIKNYDSLSLKEKAKLRKQAERFVTGSHAGEVEEVFKRIYERNSQKYDMLRDKAFMVLFDIGTKEGNHPRDKVQALTKFIELSQKKELSVTVNKGDSNDDNTVQLVVINSDPVLTQFNEENPELTADLDSDIGD